MPNDDRRSEVRDSEAPARYGRARTILVIGHMPWILEAGRDYLSAAGFRVIVATSLPGALAAAINHRPAAILAGNLLHYRALLSTLLFRLSTTPNARRVPMVVWTALPLNDSRIAEWLPGYRPGYDAVLFKICPIKELVAAVRAAAERGE